MNSTAKLWILRLLSIPMVLFFPIVCLLIVVTMADRIWGNEFPLIEVSVTLLFSIGTAIWFSVGTVFASRTDPLNYCYRLLAAITGFNVAAPFLLWLFLLPEKAYPRADLKFDTVVPPIIDVSGTWKGAWTDPRKNYTEAITLTLVQHDNVVTGSIVDEGGTNWLIIEGIVSGNRINLFYDRELAFRSHGATLLGTLNKGQLTGLYYVHESVKPGWSSKGAWQATRSGS